MRVVGVCGSLQERSTTAAVLASVADLVTAAPTPVEAGADGGPALIEYHRFRGIDRLPHFNPDHDDDPAHPEVATWRNALAAADAVVIATPEYAHSYPGALKDALDWTVGSGELVDKPVLLVTASGGGGVHAGEALAQVLRAMSAQVIGPVSIWGVSPKIADDRLTDVDDLSALAAAVTVLLTHADPHRP
ncbi:NADPH-dependent FMN reductase [Aquihabitans sp. McL0605]|uniref:NADPH-dependent FMN reductase n=1 Tax=Aquihabitans sp. McL0605 TaxID=3415671 RepID=UPI003CEB1AA6